MDRRQAVAALAAGAVFPAPAGSTPPREGEEPTKSKPPGPPPIEARLLVPLAGTKTTLRLRVTNTGKDAGVFPPFVNQTQLLVTPPGGEAEAYGRCEENRAPDELKAGETRSWDIDLADHVAFTMKGSYVIAFRVGPVRSNEVILAVDTPVPQSKPAPAAAAVRKRAEALLTVLRAKQWG